MLNQLADDVATKNMAFLDTRCIIRGYIDQHIAECRECAARFAGKTNGSHLVFACGLKSLNNIFTVATCAQPHEHIPRLHIPFNEPAVNLPKGKIVGGSREIRGIGMQRIGGKGGTAAVVKTAT